MFIKVVDGPAPKLSWGACRNEGTERCYGPFSSSSRVTDAVRALNDLLGLRDNEGTERCYGPFSSSSRVTEAVRALNDLLGLRDCRAAMPMVFAEQGDLFDSGLRAACIRHELGFCGGPCAGFVTEAAYQDRIDTAVAFLEGRTIQPIDQVIAAMQEAGEQEEFERAAGWREKFEVLEWLFAAGNKARAAIDLLTFVYHDPGTFGDDRAYLIRQGTIRACFPSPTTPIEREAFRAVVAEELARPAPVAGALPPDAIDEVLLVMSWFRRYPQALHRTTPPEEWLARFAVAR